MGASRVAREPEPWKYLRAACSSTPNPWTHLWLRVLTAFVSHLTDVKTLYATTGVYTFSSKAPSREAVSTTPLLPVTCMNTMLQHSRMLGLTFPGIILDPGSTAGSVTSPSPAWGPELSIIRSLHTLIRLLERLGSAFLKWRKSVGNWSFL